MRIGVVLRTTDGLWSMTRFLEAETTQYFIENAPEFIDDIKDINIVDLEPCPDGHTPPDGFQVDKRGHLYWCPYCQEIRRFKEDHEFTGYHHCEICHISDADYYIRKFNHLFDNEADEKKRKKREESNQ
jgi:hypothetical protein